MCYEIDLLMMGNKNIIKMWKSKENSRKILIFIL